MALTLENFIKQLARKRVSLCRPNERCEILRNYRGWRWISPQKTICGYLEWIGWDVQERAKLDDTRLLRWFRLVRVKEVGAEQFFDSPTFSKNARPRLPIGPETDHNGILRVKGAVGDVGRTGQHATNEINPTAGVGCGAVFSTAISIRLPAAAYAPQPCSNLLVE